MNEVLAPLVSALRADGWHIVPTVEAYEDPIAARDPDTLWLGQGRVAALAAGDGRAQAALTWTQQVLLAEQPRSSDPLPPSETDTSVPTCRCR